MSFNLIAKSFSLKSNINLIKESILRPLRFYASLDLSMSYRERWYFLIAFILLLISLVSGSIPRRVGDGAEYLAMALNLSDFHLPAVSPEELTHLQERLAPLEESGYAIPITYPNLVAKDGRQDFPHFWFYSALAAPMVWVTRVLHLHPAASFTIVNMALLILALWVVVGRLDWAATLLLFGGPIIWWIDKSCTEVFTFSLIAISFTLLLERPWWSLVCLGAAATQNPPIAVVVPIVVVMALINRPGALRDIRFQVGAIVGAALASLPPLYYMSRLGITSPLLRTTGGPSLHLPTLSEMGTFIWDPNLGLLPGFPAWTVVLLGITGALIASARQRLKSPAVWVAFLTTGIFLAGFAQMTMVNAGGTPGISRYTLWLISLAIPLLQEADIAFGQKLRLWLVPVAIYTLIWGLCIFHPKLPENVSKPTKLAVFIWKHYPSLNNPLPEIFFKRVSHKYPPIFPIATATCSKVLLVGGHWPTTCKAEGAVPPHCIDDPAALCYANRTAHGYEFVKVSGYIVKQNLHIFGVSHTGH